LVEIEYKTTYQELDTKSYPEKWAKRQRSLWL